MKKWQIWLLWALFLIGMWLAQGCSCQTHRSEERPSRIMGESAVMVNGLRVDILRVDGCDYLSVYNGGIVHMETCQNPIHHQK